MRIIVKVPIDARFGHPFLTAPSYLHLAAGSEIEVDGNLYDGDVISGINKWYKDAIGNYYWSGGAQPFSQGIATSQNQLIDYRKQFSYLNTNWFNTNGKGIRIGIIDTGFYLNHPDLTHLKQTAIIKDCAQNGGNSDDIEGHGTHVLGLLAASQLSNNLTGLIPEASFFLYKAYLNGVGFIDSFVADAIYECIKNNVDIINLSLSVTTPLGSSLEKALNSAINSNIFLVAAAGEENDLIQPTISFPAQFKKVISLGETSRSFLQTLSKPINSKVDFLMPLDDIRSCWINNPIGNYYKNLKGSSMGSSFLTGILASALSAGVSKQDLIPTLKSQCTTFNTSVFNNATLKIVKL